MRILIVANFYPPRAVGGAEIVAHRHAVELKRHGHEVAVFAGRVPKSDQHGGEMTLENVDGIDVHLMSIRTLDVKRSFHWDASGRRFRAVLRHFRPDVVHFHNLVGLGVNLVLEAKRFGARTICTVHDHWGFCAKNTLLFSKSTICTDFENCHLCVDNVIDETGKALPSRLRRDYLLYCLSKVDELVFPSRYLRDAYVNAGFDPTNMHYVSNGVEIERFAEKKPKPKDAPLHVAVIGYLGEHKGLDVLIDAMEELRADAALNGRWKVSIVGDGHMRARVQKLSENPAWEGSCDYLGKLPQPDIPELLQDVDVVLLPSIWPENEPVVLLEAIAAGVAQVGSDAGGHRELIVDGKSGRLFRRTDAADLAAKLRAYVEDPDLARRHGRYNRDRREDFAQAKSVAAYEALYRAESRPARTFDPVVLCDAEWPTLEVAQLFNNLSMFEKEKKVRVVYAGWADDQLWSDAEAVFVWSHAAREDLLLRALRRGITVIAPAGNVMVDFLEREDRPSFGYRDMAEAMAALVAIAEAPADAAPTPVRDDLADYVAAAVRPEAHGLYAEIPSV